MRKLALLAFVAASFAAAEEGKWTPQQVLQLDPAWLKQQGLQLPVSQLWDAKRGTGLLAAAVAVPGCSAGFVSSTGLILTNHHYLFSLIQEHSRPDRDLIIMPNFLGGHLNPVTYGFHREEKGPMETKLIIDCTRPAIRSGSAGPMPL